MLLGIKADVVRKLEVTLKFFDDKNPDEIDKQVTLTVGKAYNVQYYDTAKDKAFGIFGVLISTEEINTREAGHFTTRSTNPTTYNEVVGIDNLVYLTDKSYKDDGSIKRDHLDYMDIRFVFDTSYNLDGNYEVIMLSNIRDCDLIDDDPYITPKEESFEEEDFDETLEEIPDLTQDVKFKYISGFNNEEIKALQSIEDGLVGNIVDIIDNVWYDEKTEDIIFEFNNGIDSLRIKVPDEEKDDIEFTKEDLPVTDTIENLNIPPKLPSTRSPTVYYDELYDY